MSPLFSDRRHMKIASLSALHTERLFLPEKIPGTHFCYGLSGLQSQSAVGRFKSIKNLKTRIENQTRALLACSEVRKLTALTRIPKSVFSHGNMLLFYLNVNTYLNTAVLYKHIGQLGKGLCTNVEK